jgi:hypothetical protein
MALGQRAVQLTHEALFSGSLPASAERMSGKIWRDGTDWARQKTIPWVVNVPLLEENRAQSS